MLYRSFSKISSMSVSGFSGIYQQLFSELSIKWNIVNPLLLKSVNMFVFSSTEDFIFEYLWSTKYFKKYFVIN